jgi:hypothetical protein
MNRFLAHPLVMFPLLGGVPTYPEREIQMRKAATAVSLSVLAGVSALSQHKPRQRVSRAPRILATALLCATALSQPNLAYAAPHGGGGGLQGGGGFHSDGFHGGGFDAGRFDGDRFRRRDFFGGFYAYPGWVSYCSDPPGYYPYVTQCTTGWRTVPAS